MLPPVVAAAPDDAVLADVRWYLDGSSGRDAYENGYVRVVGQDEILKLIGRVIERHETRAKIKKRRA